MAAIRYCLRRMRLIAPSRRSLPEILRQGIRKGSSRALRVTSANRPQPGFNLILHFHFGTTMQVAPAREGEDQLKDIDFTPHGISSRMQAGLAEGRRPLKVAPWQQPVDRMAGVIVHEQV